MLRKQKWDQLSYKMLSSELCDFELVFLGMHRCEGVNVLFFSAVNGLVCLCFSLLSDCLAFVMGCLMTQTKTIWTHPCQLRGFYQFNIRRRFYPLQAELAGSSVIKLNCETHQDFRTTPLFFRKLGINSQHLNYSSLFKDECF